MTLDEAIEHAKEVARTCDDSQCAADHMQLAEWLRKARGAEKAARWYTAKIRELEEECASLKKAFDFQSLELGCMTENRDVLYVENAKLRKLVRELWDGYNDPSCEDCPLKDKPACIDCPICAREAAVIERMRELGIEPEA